MHTKKADLEKEKIRKCKKKKREKSTQRRNEKKWKSEFEHVESGKERIWASKIWKKTESERVKNGKGNLDM